MNASIAQRIKKLRHGIKAAGIDAMIVQDRINTIYLTGFPCSYSILLVDARELTFITDSRYAEAAEKALSPAFRVIVQPTCRVNEFLRALIAKKGYSRAGFEGTISVDEHDAIRKLTRGTRLVKSTSLITDLRRVKDDSEIAIIRKAVRIGDALMAATLKQLKPGIRESDISQSVRMSAEILGASGESFANIIASGPNSSRPHHHPGSRKLRAGDPVTVDLGVVYKGYCSDLTRTPVLGKASKKFEQIYNVCLEANEAAIKTVRPGMQGAEVDAVARDIIEHAGYGKHFGHGLGHGVGLQIHEAPTLSPRAPDYKLEPGNIVTIEPGIYLPGVGGVRIEDYLLITRNGAEVLSKAPKKLTIIPC